MLTLPYLTLINQLRKVPHLEQQRTVVVYPLGDRAERENVRLGLLFQLADVELVREVREIRLVDTSAHLVADVTA